MASDQSFVRHPWVALTLSFLSSGVGHLYCGRVTKGLFLYAARFLLPLLCVFAAFSQRSTGVLVGLILLPAAATIIIFLYSAVDAWAIARRTGPEYRPKDYNRASLYWLLIVMQLAYPVALTWVVNEHVFEAYVIPVRSMSPNFMPGDRILVNKRPLHDGAPQRGDLVVFRAPPSDPQRTWIKRVIGVAGDQIAISGGEIEVNGKVLEREQVPSAEMGWLPNRETADVYYELHAGRRYQVLMDDEYVEGDLEDDINVTVAENSIFVMGDNRDLSRDSRHFGPISVNNVIGYVDYIFYPAESWSRFGVVRD